MTEIKGKAAQNRKKQVILLAVVGAVVVGVAIMASLFTTPPQAVAPAKAPEAKLIAVPGGKGNEQASWRTKEAVRLQAQNDTLNNQLKDLQKRLTDFQEQQRQKEIEKADLERKEKERLALAEAMPKQPPIKPVGAIPDPNIAMPNNGASQMTGPKPYGLNESLNADGLQGQVKASRGIVSVAVYSAPAESKATSKLDVVDKIKTQIDKKLLDKDDEDDGTYMTSGSFVRVVLLSGLDAPTGGQAQNNPHPVLFRVLDPAQLPNMFKVDVKDCVITGNGYGDLSAERVHVRLDRLSCIDEEGNATDIKVAGYASGEDGKEGLRGRLVTKQGQVIAKAMLAGLVDGIGTIVKQSSMTQTSIGGFGTTNTLDPNKVAQAGVGGAIGNAGTVLSKYYMNLANQLFPVLEVDAGRVVDVIFSRGNTLGSREK